MRHHKFPAGNDGHTERTRQDSLYPGSHSNSQLPKKNKPQLARHLLLLVCVSVALISASICTAGDDEQREIHVLADTTQYDFLTEDFFAIGKASVTYGDMLITADSITGNVSTGQVQASGNVTFRQADRIFSAHSLAYNFLTGLGQAQEANASVGGVYFQGQQLTAETGRFVVSKSRFTTCNQPKPHYYVSAKELVIQPQQRLIARHASIVLFGNRIISIPTYSMRLRERERKQFELPQIGISGEYGLHAGYKFNLSHSDSTQGTLRAVVSTRQVFQGGFEYRRIRGKPIILNLTYRQPHYGGASTDSLVSRLPEVGYAYVSPGLQGKTFDADAPERIVRQVVKPQQVQDSRPLAGYLGQISAGYFIEDPGRIRSYRFDVRSASWLKPRYVGAGIFLMPAALFRHSTYESGKSYTDLGLSVSVTKVFRGDSYASVTYVRHSIGGSTPFKFDAVELKHELAAGVRFPLGDLDLELQGRYDLEGRRFFDSEISIGKLIHCVEPRLTWRKRFKEIGLDVALVGF